MKIAITGATGFVGKELVKKLAVNHQIVVLTRNVDKARSVFPSNLQSNLEYISYNPKQAGDWQKQLNGCDGVVNLAGAPIGERWSPSYKQEILDSRQLGTRNLVEGIKSCEQKPAFLINASAIGFYGTSETATYTEVSPAGDDFLAKVCVAWEEEAQKVKDVDVRLVIFRFGIVLGDGGALAKMIPPFKIFAGGPIGEGKQWFSWIHIDDLVNLLVRAIAHSSIEGTFNATAPYPVTMNQLCETLGDVMNRPSWLPVPGFALELLLGDGAKVVLEGQKVLPEKTTQTMGYDFQYADLESALKDIVN
ncbi:TIGR01777 family protein [Cyanobacterium stanieri LEGE 03274]|uniref:TIGR01777 family protein n=1 Tax=Cyanobacterium stanieri LEGE 03274 TaxID=1828756 RepID=A0ABR9V3Z7_9CHRO|nr:TIGR01777 family oxidoreductase [Cyanobacterium stanieri]MBE9221871.1 TIGR01777 family protein [Cyanobacterium stanieri LEGE 03274]